MSDPKKSTEFLNHVRRLKGVYRFDIRKYRPRRTDRQNSFYWPCFVHPFGQFLREQGQPVTDDEAHEILKHKFLKREVVDESTGEVMTFTGSTTKLDTKEFNEYLDNVAAWLHDFFGVVMPDPTDYHEQDS